MEETYYVGAYWLARKESASACAPRFERFLGLLSHCDPTFSQWFKKGRTREAALEHRFASDAGGIATFFNQQSQEDGRRETSGWTAHLWNGQPDGTASGLSIHCGDASPRLPNSCLLYPPEEPPVAERLLRAHPLASILRAMVLAWEPEWGIATSHEHRDSVTESGEAGTFVGWLTYFSHRRGALPALPPSVQLESVEDLGTLVLLTPERFTLANPTHVELAREVSERLAHAGLLSPLRPGSS
ncbi:immunity 52 family protein [Cystobacter fuscus]|uniref:immunity 52 family protein n=1 Tax=Cystobacter fuscus TaxID=43 RepID=UPI002B2F1F4E|nr:hypothetical protein F0U63_48625 [Cystobacter fuscus]